MSGQVSVCELKSGPGQGRDYPMQTGKTPLYFPACLRKNADW